MIATEFEYDGIKSSVYGLYICSFDGARTGTYSLGNDVTIHTVQAPGKKQLIKSGSTWENPLTFQFQVAKYDCSSGVQEITSRELAHIMRWLIRSDNYHYLRFIQTGWDNIFYNCSLKLQKHEIDGKIYGLDIEATCDSPWGWSERKEYTFDTTLSGKKSFNLYNYSDEDGALLPDLVELQILSKEPCDLTVINRFSCRKEEETLEHKLVIHNCSPGEILSMDKHKNIVSNLPHEQLYNDFNHNFLHLYSDLTNNENEISVSVDCKMRILWREVRKGVC